MLERRIYDSGDSLLLWRRYRDYLVEESDRLFLKHAEGFVEITDTISYFYVVTDHLLNTRLIMNAAGETVRELTYYPFGMVNAELSSADTTGYDFLFTGKEWITDLGIDLYDYGARYLDPELGRWGGVDPMAEGYLAESPYTMNMNNPFNRIDRDGNASETNNESVTLYGEEARRWLVEQGFYKPEELRTEKDNENFGDPDLKKILRILTGRYTQDEPYIDEYAIESYLAQMSFELVNMAYEMWRVMTNNTYDPEYSYKLIRKFIDKKIEYHVMSEILGGVENLDVILNEIISVLAETNWVGAVSFTIGVATGSGNILFVSQMISWVDNMDTYIQVYNGKENLAAASIETIGIIIGYKAPVGGAAITYGLFPWLSNNRSYR